METHYLCIDMLTKEDIKKRINPPLGYTFEEHEIVLKLLLDLCNEINDIMSGSGSLEGIGHMNIEHVIGVFWAGSAMVYMEENNVCDDTLYSICQLLYLIFGKAQQFIPT